MERKWEDIGVESLPAQVCCMYRGGTLVTRTTAYRALQYRQVDSVAAHSMVWALSVSLFMPNMVATNASLGVPPGVGVDACMGQPAPRTITVSTADKRPTQPLGCCVHQANSQGGLLHGITVMGHQMRNDLGAAIGLLCSLGTSPRRHHCNEVELVVDFFVSRASLAKNLLQPHSAS